MKYGFRPTNLLGFSIVEAVVALFLLLLCTAGIFQGLSLSFTQGAESREQVMGHLLAESVIEDITAHPWGTTEPPPGWETQGNDWVRTETVEAVVEGIPGIHHYQLRISDHEQGALATVEWKEKSGPKRLKYPVAREQGWRTAPGQTKPPPVTENWHEPGPIEYPSEPSNDHGETHGITPNDPDPGSDVDDKTAALAAKIQALRNEKNQIDQQIADNKQQISQLNKQIAHASDDEKADLQQQKRSLEQDNQRLQKESNQKRTQIEKLVNELNQA